MTIETQIFLHIAMVIGAFVSIPFITRMFILLGRYVTSIIYPITEVLVEYENEEGVLCKKVIKLSDSDELVMALNQRKVGCKE